MRRLHSLQQRRDFRRLYRQGRVYRGSLLVVRMFRSSVSKSRLAFAARRDLGSAVVRNRTKRRLREAARSLPLAAGWDVLITARASARTAGYTQLHSELERLLSRAGALDQTVT